MQYISRISEDGREQATLAHLKECAGFAGRLGEKFDVQAIAHVCALFHDAGKLSEAFVSYLKSQEGTDCRPIKRGAVIHSTQGAKYLYEAQAGPGSQMAGLVREIAAICVAGHHSGLMDGISPGGDTPLRGRLAEEKEALHYGEVRRAMENAGLTQDVQKMLGQGQRELEGFLAKCRIHQLDPCFMLHLLTKCVFSCLVDADRLNAYCFETKRPMETGGPHLPRWEEYARRLEESLLSFPNTSEIDRIRREVSGNCLEAAGRQRGVYRLEVPTGGGKTLSSLRFALNHAKAHAMARIVYVIPYLSVLEQAAKDIKEALQYGLGDDYILEHHSSAAVPGGREEAQARRLLTDRWDSPIIITTMVQFLESVYSHRSGDLRKLHNMADSVFIFDEVQSLPLKCTYLFNEALNFLHHFAKCSVVLCSATQPPLDRTERPVYLSPSPALIPDTSGRFLKLRRARIVNCTIPGGYPTEALQQFVREKYGEEGNCLVILNTKREAAALFCSLRRALEAAPDSPVALVHLSTSLCPAHRLDVIGAMKAQKQRHTLCVSTQLIEAGVDISFACVVRAMAGLDSIAQAAGRCNRNGESPRCKNVYLVNVADEDLSMLPDIKCGSDVTYNILSENEPDLLSPAAMKRYYALYYSRRKEVLEYPAKSGISLCDLLSVNLKGFTALINQGGGTPPALPQAFQSAGELFSVLEQRSASVLVPYGAGAGLAQKYRGAGLGDRAGLLRQMGAYCVSLYPHQFKKLDGLGALCDIGDGVWLLDGAFYDKKLGVVYAAAPGAGQD